MSYKNVSPVGWIILQHLAERQLTRKAFCRQHRIPENRLSEIITGNTKRKNYAQKSKLAQILGLPDDIWEASESGEAGFRPSGSAE